jgi:hypothetical protein
MSTARAVLGWRRMASGALASISSIHAMISIGFPVNR